MSGVPAVLTHSMKFFSLSLVLILSLALTGCGWNPFHKMYSATAEIQIRPHHVIEVPGLNNAPYPPTYDPKPIIAEIEIMQSNDVLFPIIEDLKLDQIWAKRFKSDHDALSPQEALDHLREVLKIEVVPQTNLIKITAYSELPQEAADIANAVADRYKTIREIEEDQRYNRGADALRDQVAQQQRAVDDAKLVAEKLPIDGTAERNVEQQQAILDALNVRLKQVIADGQLAESPVRIISRAVPPPE